MRWASGAVASAAAAADDPETLNGLACAPPACMLRPP
jgi:hypothetical protein